MKKQTCRIATRLSEVQRKTIEEKISAGEYENLSDFLRTAIDLALEIGRALSS